MSKSGQTRPPFAVVSSPPTTTAAPPRRPAGGGRGPGGKAEGGAARAAVRGRVEPADPPRRAAVGRHLRRTHGVHRGRSVSAAPEPQHLDTAVHVEQVDVVAAAL